MLRRRPLLIILLIIAIVLAGLMAWKFVPGLLKEEVPLAALPQPDLTYYTEGMLRGLERQYTSDDVFTVTSAEQSGDNMTMTLAYGDIPGDVDTPEIPGQVFRLTISRQMYDDILYGGTIFTGYEITVRQYAVPVDPEDADILSRVGGGPESSDYSFIKAGLACFLYTYVYSDIYGDDPSLVAGDEAQRVLDDVNTTGSARTRHLFIPEDYALFMDYFGTADAPNTDEPVDVEIPTFGGIGEDGEGVYGDGGDADVDSLDEGAADDETDGAVEGWDGGNAAEADDGGSQDPVADPSVPAVNEDWDADPSGGEPGEGGVGTHIGEGEEGGVSGDGE